LLNLNQRPCSKDWITGTKLSDQEALREQGLDVLQLVDTGIQCSLRCGGAGAGPPRVFTVDPALAACLQPNYDNPPSNFAVSTATCGATLRQLLEFGYFHADPHPGNLLATPEGKLAFLDFGMMSETPESARYAIIEHVVHLVNRDYEAMVGRCRLTLGSRN